MKSNLFSLIVLVMSAIVIAGCSEQAYLNDNGENTQNNNGNEQPEVVGEGRIVFGVTDVGVEEDSISSLSVTIDKIEAHNSEKGWIKIMDTPTTVDLIALDKEDVIKLLADVNLESGTYQQFRMVISKIIITHGGDIKSAILPSSEIKIVGDLNVSPNEISTVVFDFKVEDSVHMAGNGKYIFAPVIQFETRENADVNIEDRKDGKIVQINSGKIDTNIEVGMDIKGNVGIGLKVPKDKKLTIKAGEVIDFGI